MKAIIIDDDRKAINDLTDKLSKHEDIEVVATTTSASFGLKMLQTEVPDLMFLDVEMPEMTGLDFLQEMERMNVWCHVIVTTSYSIYMLPAFRREAFDFLTKPINEKELATALERVRKDLESPRRSQTTPQQPQSGFLLCYTNTDDFQLVNISTIGLFRYSGEIRSWEVIIGNQQLPVKLKREVTNKDLLALDSRFVQVSQKYIVNINCLLKVRDNICVFNPPFEDIDYVKVGRMYRKRLVDKFISF